MVHSSTRSRYVQLAADEVEAVNREVNRRMYTQEAQDAEEEHKRWLLWARNFGIAFLAVFAPLLINGFFLKLPIDDAFAPLVFLYLTITLVMALSFAVIGGVFWVRKMAMLEKAELNAT